MSYVTAVCEPCRLSSLKLVDRVGRYSHLSARADPMKHLGRPSNNGASPGDRARLSRLQGGCIGRNAWEAWCRREESNPGHPPYEGGVLPLNYEGQIDKRTRAQVTRPSRTAWLRHASNYLDVHDLKQPDARTSGVVASS